MINAGPCCVCGSKIHLPDELYHSARRTPKISFWCSYGHEQCFPAGESEAAQLRRERDRLKQDAARLEDQIRRERENAAAAERRASAARGQVTRLKNRAAAGVCPCCNRTFQNLARHMAGEHPQFKAEEIA